MKLNPVKGATTLTELCGLPKTAFKKLIEKREQQQADYRRMADEKTRERLLSEAARVS